MSFFIVTVTMPLEKKQCAGQALSSLLLEAVFVMSSITFEKGSLEV